MSCYEAGQRVRLTVPVPGHARRGVVTVPSGSVGIYCGTRHDGSALVAFDSEVGAVAVRCAEDRLVPTYMGTPITVVSG